MKQVVFIIPIIRTDYIERCLRTLRLYTDPSLYKLIIVDQSIEGLSEVERNRLFEDDEMYIRMRNAGFSKAVNEGLMHALKWQVPYIGVINDDTEFMYDKWFPDLLEEFKTDPQIVAVCPESPRIAMWGYGLNKGEHVELIPHKEVFSAADIAYLKQGDYSREEVQSRHEFKIPESFPFTKRGVIDGIAMWCPIFKREAFIELGLFEERFVWGGGEDYDFLARAYSCAYPLERETCDPIYHRRMVSTMKSWVWHWWGKSKDVKQTLNPKLFEGRKPWNDLNALWSPSCDVWGHVEIAGVRKPVKRKSPVFIEPA